LRLYDDLRLCCGFVAALGFQPLSSLMRPLQASGKIVAVNTDFSRSLFGSRHDPEFTTSNSATDRIDANPEQCGKVALADRFSVVAVNELRFAIVLERIAVFIRV
jgi:hypothetical protein